MNPTVETQRIQQTLKTLLKKRNYSYQNLARDLGVSLPTVKRTLTANDFSLDRLTRICELLGVPLLDLFELARSTDTDLHYFTSDQEKFFASNPMYLTYLFALYSERKTPAEIEKSCGISRASTRKYLKKLSELKLIQVVSGGRIKVLIQGLIGWDDRGVLGKTLSEHKIRGMAERAISGESEDLHLILSGRCLTTSEYEAMKKELDEITAKYRRISKINASLRNLSKLHSYEVVIIADRHSRKICDEIFDV